jgi:hypothetical protein
MAKEKPNQALTNSRPREVDELSNQDLINEFHKQIPALLSQTRVSFLIGAGCSRCAGLPLMGSLTQQVCDRLSPDTTCDKDLKSAFELLNEIRNRYIGVETASIEDYLSEIQDIDAILSRQIAKGVENPIYHSGSNEYKFEHTQLILKKIKENIADILKNGVTSIDTHRSFTRAVHYKLIKGRERAQAPVNYFILNYDTLFEDALALEGVTFSDGFIGGATAWWDPQCFGGEDQLTFGQRQLEARIYKLHGSIDWVRPEKSELPIRVRTTLPVEGIIGRGEPVVIYPASNKYKVTQHDPYSQMMISFRKHLARTSNHVLGIIGYSFNDEHINVEIESGIQRSNGALSVIIFFGGEELPPSVIKWLSDESIYPQILLLGKNGLWKNGSKILETDDELDWYRFERISDLLGR